MFIYKGINEVFNRLFQLNVLIDVIYKGIIKNCTCLKLVTELRKSTFSDWKICCKIWDCGYKSVYFWVS